MRMEYSRDESMNLALWTALSRSQQGIYREVLRVFKDHNLSAGQFAVLEVLYHKEPLSVGDIIEKILITGGNITVVIQNLEKKGLLTQRVDHEDSRKKVIEITKEGIRVLEGAFKVHLDKINEILDVYSEEEKKTLFKLLRKTNKGEL